MYRVCLWCCVQLFFCRRRRCCCCVSLDFNRLMKRRRCPGLLFSLPVFFAFPPPQLGTPVCVKSVKYKIPPPRPLTPQLIRLCRPHLAVNTGVREHIACLRVARAPGGKKRKNPRQENKRTARLNGTRPATPTSPHTWRPRTSPLLPNVKICPFFFEKLRRPPGFTRWVRRVRLVAATFSPLTIPDSEVQQREEWRLAPFKKLHLFEPHGPT